MLITFISFKKAEGDIEEAKLLMKDSDPEIKQMAEIGKKDPERLAKVLSGMLRGKRDSLRAGRAQLDSQVAEIVNRDEKKI